MCGEFKSVLFGYLALIFVGPVILVSPSEPEKRDCGNVPVDICLKKLQTFLQLTSLPFTTEKSQLDTLCNNTVSGYNCSSQKASAPNCISKEEAGLFSVFVNMAEYTMFMFCDLVPGSQAYLRDTLLENSECILKQKEALDCCAKQSNLPEFPILYILDESKSLTERQIATCCPVSNYITCARKVVYSNCGEVAGNLTIEYIRRASGEQMESVCQKLPNYPVPDPDVCKEQAPVCAGCRLSSFLELIVFTILVYVATRNKCM